MNVLVLNAGSSSLKYQLVNLDTGQRALAGTVEELGERKTHDDALKELLASLGDARVDAVGHRVVHGGERFVDAVRIDDEVV
ncbi:MAG: acetate kinase, partial [Myxococcota bacterium]|nr:acetate kinase [Myxococcota bacterium]